MRQYWLIVRYVPGMPADELAGARVYWSLPLDGSPAGRLHDASMRTIAAGTLPSCPHPDQLFFWYLPAGLLTCAECTSDLLEAADRDQPGCHSCGGPATALATWVAGGIPCIGPLCEPCQRAGLVPLIPN
jgi:hypothetical protein